jgi:hypothetical protein
MKRLLIQCLVFLALVLLFGFAGECDRQAAQRYERVKADIYRSAPLWAARE